MEKRNCPKCGSQMIYEPSNEMIATNPPYQVGYYCCDVCKIKIRHDLLMTTPMPNQERLDYETISAEGENSNVSEKEVSEAEESGKKGTAKT